MEYDKSFIHTLVYNCKGYKKYLIFYEKTVCVSLTISKTWLLIKTKIKIKGIVQEKRVRKLIRIKSNKQTNLAVYRNWN